DLILFVGGLFLIGKSTREIHVKMETAGHEPNPHAKGDLLGTVIQIALLDIVFSLDSVITAVAMAKDLAVMIAAVTISVLVMLLAAGTISRFVGRHPTIAGAGFPDFDRGSPGGGWARSAHRKRLHLFRDGFLNDRRDAQHSGPLPAMRQDAS
ncbi:MAG: hypothetical protein QOH78_2533, partial [Verrucomicrobiota bacterium]